MSLQGQDLFILGFFKTVHGIFVFFLKRRYKSIMVLFGLVLELLTITSKFPFHFLLE